jgi:hypothetical protein
LRGEKRIGGGHGMKPAETAAIQQLHLLGNAMSKKKIRSSSSSSSSFFFFFFFFPSLLLLVWFST